MADEPDGIEEAFHGALRVALTVAGRAAERAARTREQTARQAEAASGQQARELQARLDAERAAARASLAPVDREQWWATATPDRVAAAWETARAWRGVDPDARRAGDRIRDEVRTRYGIDPEDPRPEPGALRDALQARENSDRDTARQGQDRRRDAAVAAELLGEADRADRADRAPQPTSRAEQDGGVLYDSAERRRGLATSLKGVVDAEAVQARLLADANQARPAGEAITPLPGKDGHAHRQHGRTMRQANDQRKTPSR